MGRKNDKFIVAYEDLEKHKDKSVEEYIEIASRSKKYREHVRRSGLRDEVWCQAMDIPPSAHKGFMQAYSLTPEDVLEMSKALASTVRRVITRARKRNNDKRKERLYKNLH